MIEQQKSYRQIFKSTALFGGLQVFKIFISIIRSKIIAVLLGPGGMGIAGLLISTTGFITSLTNFGLSTSAVKNVAAANETNNEERISTIVTVLRKLVWITGLLGMIITIILAPYLSEITFGNKEYFMAFIWISITLLFQQLSSGQLVVLQGLRKLDYLAKASFTGSIIGLFISIPVFYFWRLDGIVPVIIISSFASMLNSWYYAKKLKIKPSKITLRHVFIEGTDMIKMGFILSLNGLITVGISYFVRIFISHTGGIEQVGLYNAGFALINTYVGMVFTAMSTDYYPRLSAISFDNKSVRNLINQQAEVALLILAPIIGLFLIFINQLVILLYSERFIGINEMIHWAALGIYFKAASWSIAFILLAKGAAKIFFWNELLANIYVLLFNIIGYKLAGLEGIGISFLVGYFVYFFQVFLLAKIKYSFSFYSVFYKVASIQLILSLLCFLVIKILNNPFNLIFGTILIVLSVIYSFKELEKRINLKDVFKAKYNNLINH